MLHFYNEIELNIQWTLENTKLGKSPFTFCFVNFKYLQNVIWSKIKQLLQHSDILTPKDIKFVFIEKKLKLLYEAMAKGYIL